MILQILDWSFLKCTSITCYTLFWWTSQFVHVVTQGGSMEKRTLTNTATNSAALWTSRVR